MRYPSKPQGTDDAHERGLVGTHHNSCQGTEMKKLHRPASKLRVDRETLRRLSETDLPNVQGGQTPQTHIGSICEPTMKTQPSQDNQVC